MSTAVLAHWLPELVPEGSAISHTNSPSFPLENGISVENLYGSSRFYEKYAKSQQPYSE